MPLTYILLGMRLQAGNGIFIDYAWPYLLRFNPFYNDVVLLNLILEFQAALHRVEKGMASAIAFGWML